MIRHRQNLDGTSRSFAAMNSDVTSSKRDSKILLCRVLMSCSVVTVFKIPRSKPLPPRSTAATDWLSLLATFLGVTVTFCPKDFAILAILIAEALPRRLLAPFRFIDAVAADASSVSQLAPDPLRPVPGPRTADLAFGIGDKKVLSSMVGMSMFFLFHKIRDDVNNKEKDEERK